MDEQEIWRCITCDNLRSVLAIDVVLYMKSIVCRVRWVILMVYVLFENKPKFLNFDRKDMYGQSRRLSDTFSVLNFAVKLEF